MAGHAEAVPRRRTPYCLSVASRRIVDGRRPSMSGRALTPRCKSGRRYATGGGLHGAENARGRRFTAGGHDVGRC